MAEATQGGTTDHTLAATFENEGDESESDVDEQPPEQKWGQLTPLTAGLQVFDLIESRYEFGRKKTCHCRFDDRRISNVHFVLTKEIPEVAASQYVADSEFAVFVEDRSANGTYINGERLGKGNKALVYTNDEIAMGPKDDSPKFLFRLQHAEKPRKSLGGRYDLVRKLGSGACGEVWEAVESATGRKYAVKQLSKRRFNSAGRAAPSATELEKEVDIMKKLNHPNIIYIHDYIDEREKLSIVLELAMGGELFDAIVENGKFTEERTRFTLIQILQAVQYLHNDGIAHRDLKPENILLAKKKEDALIKLTDFGLAKLVGPQSFMRTMCGTPSYQAPEVLRQGMRADPSLEGYGPAVDMWSIGVILYIMLCGFPPFSEEITVDGLSLQDQILNGKYRFTPPYWDRISDEAKDLVKKLLVVDPSKRLTVEQALEHEFVKKGSTLSEVAELQEQYRLKRAKQMTETPTNVNRSKRDNAGDDGDAPPAKKPATGIES